jgi:hypothetical protein
LSSTGGGARHLGLGGPTASGANTAGGGSTSAVGAASGAVGNLLNGASNVSLPNPTTALPRLPSPTLPTLPSLPSLPGVGSISVPPLPKPKPSHGNTGTIVEQGLTIPNPTSVIAPLLNKAGLG